MSNESQEQTVFCVWNEEFYPLSEMATLVSGKYVHKDYLQTYMDEYFFVCAYDRNTYSRDLMVQADDGEFVHELNLDDYEHQGNWDDERFNKTMYGLA